MGGKGVFHWLPRLLSAAFVLFVSLFALDTWPSAAGWGDVAPFLAHLIPSFLLLAAVLIAWKRDLVGAVAFLGFAALYVVSVGFGRHWSWYAVISGPAAAVGLLFLWNWFRGRRGPKTVE